jgi:hypothetical protein
MGLVFILRIYECHGYVFHDKEIYEWWGEGGAFKPPVA